MVRMAKPTFYTEADLNDLPNARSFLAEQHIDVTERDINKEPPDCAFLEQHIDDEHFLDFVSTRSPVFKKRALPRSRRKPST